MTTERIKEIQKTTGYPDSVSIQQALLQVWNEVAQESVPLDGCVKPMRAERYILCAAIWYDDEFTHVHQPVKTGIVLCGHRHHNIIGQAIAMGLKDRGYREVEQGFITNDNLFVTRKAAEYIAKKANQLKDGKMISAILTSEDLW